LTPDTLPGINRPPYHPPPRGEHRLDRRASGTRKHRRHQRTKAWTCFVGIHSVGRCNARSYIGHLDGHVTAPTIREFRRVGPLLIAWRGSPEGGPRLDVKMRGIVCRSRIRAISPLHSSPSCAMACSSASIMVPRPRKPHGFLVVPSWTFPRAPENRRSPSPGVR